MRRSSESRRARSGIVAGDRPKVSRIFREQLGSHLRAQVFKHHLQLSYQHRAIRDVANASRSAFEITEMFSPCVILPLRARTVMPLVRRSDDWEIWNVDPGDSMQTISDDFFLRRELGVVINLLKITTAAPPKIWTRRFDSIRRWCEDLFDRSEGDAAFYSIDADAQAIAGRSECHHYCLAIGMRQTESARQNSFDGDFHKIHAPLSSGLPPAFVSGSSPTLNDPGKHFTLSGVQEKQAQARHANMFAQSFFQKVLAGLREYFFVHVTLVRFNLRIDFRLELGHLRERR
jgi:hypothetical protein